MRSTPFSDMIGRYITNLSRIHYQYEHGDINDRAYISSLTEWGMLFVQDLKSEVHKQGYPDAN